MHIEVARRGVHRKAKIIGRLLVPASWLVGVEFSPPLDTVYVISEAVFTANHLTDTDKLDFGTHKADAR